MRLGIKKGWLSAFVVVFAVLTASAAYGHAPQINLTVADTTTLVCQGDTICISIKATDTDAGNTITITKISGAETFSSVSGPSPLNAAHCFAPDTSGTYRFIFQAKDNTNLSSRDTLDIAVTMEFQPKFFVNSIQIQPLGSCQQDVLTSFCNSKQNWKLLNEYTPWNNVNRFGFYTDLGVGNNRTLVFSGPDAPGARETTLVASGQQIGLWLLNDTNGNLVFDNGDSFLFSQRALTAGSGAYEHQWFTVYDVRTYKGTGASYFFNTSTEDITLTGDYDYLIFIDDDHSSANFDHNDMVVGVTEIDSPPEVICPANIVKPNAPGQCGATATYSASCTNSCGNCSVTCTPASGSFFPVGTTTVTCIATNSTNLKDTCQFTVTVNDTQKPTVTCPANITTNNTPSQCAANVSYTATASDNCGTPTLVCIPPSGSSFAVGTTTVKCKATDAAGNKDSCQFTITVNDTQKPTVACPANITTNNTAGQCAANVSYTATPADNCPGVTLVCTPPSGSSFAVGTTPVKCIATDVSGNKDSCQFTVTVNDTQKPTVACPANISVNASSGQCNAVVSYTASAADNCGTPTLVCTPPSGSTFSAGVTNVKCIATDGAGNKDSCQFTVTVTDTQKPTVSCPANITTSNTAGQCAANVSYTATAADNCGTPTLVCTPPSGSSFAVGITTVKCVATDVSGNKDSCSFTVTVNDTQKPTVSCPASIVKNNDPGQCSAVATYTASASDNCGTPTLVCTPPSGSIFPKGVTTVNCTATDGAGNQASCSFTITVNDTENPTISCPPNIVKGNSPGQCDTTVTYTAIAADNCPGVSYLCTPPSGSTFPVGTTTVTCTATDAVGNQASCQFTVTVNDNQNPTIVCSPDIVTGTDPGRCDAAVTYTVTASNGCPGVTLVCIPPSGSIFPKGVTTVNCIATDGTGNQASCSFTVRVNDDEKPAVSCPANITTNAAPGQCEATVSYNANASDNCPGVNLVCTPPSGILFHVGVTTVNCVATDGSGNKDSCQFTVTVVDDQKPVVNCPANITTSNTPGQCGAAVNYNASATDNCGPPFTNPVSLVCTPPSGFTFLVGTTPVKCVATDGSGNKDSCTFTVTVNDTQKPTVACPANITTNTATGRCDATVNYTATPGDNCPGVSLVCTPPSGSPFSKGVSPVKCVVTDASGNKDSCQFTITVNDNEKPTVACPANITTNATFGQCNATVNYTATPGDNCPGVSLVCNPPSGFSFSSGTTMVTCVATDGAGNKDSCQFMVTVTDQTPPAITCPANITKNTDPGQCNTTATYTATATDNCSGTTVVCTPPSGFSFNKGVTMVTCIATDAAGLKDTCTFTVTINDTEKPTINCPSSVTAENIPGECRALVSFVGNVSYADNCPGASLTCVPPSGSYYNVGSTLVRCTVTDASGNKDSCQFVVGVVQTSPGCDTTTTPCLELQIAKIENAYLGSDVEVSIDNISQFVDSTTLPNPSGIGGFSFLISYDCACLQFLSARKGSMLVNQGWEFFTYRYGALGNGNCGAGCPSCLIRIVAIADVNNGANHPNQTRDNQGQWAVLKFRVTNDRTLNGYCCPINWFWFDCSDNTVSDSTGNQLWVVKELTTFDGTPIDLFNAFPNNVADCDEFSGGPGKPSPKKRICFRNGGVCIPNDQDIDDRGDLNLNGLVYEVGDAVLYENYFIYGGGVFSTNPQRRQAQIAASDVNGDGQALSVADLVALIRVLTGDANPLPKLNPNAASVSLSWTAMEKELKITTSSASELGGLFVSFKYSGTAEKTVKLLTPADGMQSKVNAEAGELRILIDSDRRGAKLPAGEVSFTVPLEGQVEFVEAQASNYQGQTLPVVTKTSTLPTQFDLSQNYPNPFNPKTNFTLSMPIESHYKITIYNLLGEAVRTFEGDAPAGRQVFTWDGTDGRGHAVSSGVYLYKAEVGKQVINKKMVLMR